MANNIKSQVKAAVSFSLSYAQSEKICTEIGLACRIIKSSKFFIQVISTVNQFINGLIF